MNDYTHLQTFACTVTVYPARLAGYPTYRNPKDHPIGYGSATIAAGMDPKIWCVKQPMGLRYVLNPLLNHN